MNPSVIECNFGDFSMGRYAWQLESVEAILSIPFGGQQGLWSVKDDLIMPHLSANYQGLPKEPKPQSASL